MVLRWGQLNLPARSVLLLVCLSLYIHFLSLSKPLAFMALQLCFLLLCHPLLVGCSSKLCSFPHASLLSTSLHTSLLLYWPRHCTRYRRHRALMNSSISFQSQPLLVSACFLIWQLISDSVLFPCPALRLHPIKKPKRWNVGYSEPIRNYWRHGPLQGGKDMQKSIRYAEC